MHYNATLTFVLRQKNLVLPKPFGLIRAQRCRRCVSYFFPSRRQGFLLYLISSQFIKFQTTHWTLRKKKRMKFHIWMILPSSCHSSSLRWCILSRYCHGRFLLHIITHFCCFSWVSLDNNFSSIQAANGTTLHGLIFSPIVPIGAARTMPLTLTIYKNQILPILSFMTFGDVIAKALLARHVGVDP